MFKKFIRIFVLFIILPISIFMISCSSLSQSDITDCPQNNPSITIPSDNDNTDNSDSPDSETDSENTENNNETTENGDSENASNDENNENNSCDENNENEKPSSNENGEDLSNDENFESSDGIIDGENTENIENPDQSENDNTSDSDDATVLPPEAIEPPIVDPSDEQVNENSEYTIEFQVIDGLGDKFFSVNFYDNAFIINEFFAMDLVENSDGIVVCVNDEASSSYKYVFHFKNKDGKSIVTTSESGKHYLEFDLYYSSFFTMFDIQLNNQIIDSPMMIEFSKLSYKIEITENSTISLNILM